MSTIYDLEYWLDLSILVWLNSALSIYTGMPPPLAVQSSSVLEEPWFAEGHGHIMAYPFRRPRTNGGWELSRRIQSVLTVCEMTLTIAKLNVSVCRHLCGQLPKPTKMSVNVWVSADRGTLSAVTGLVDCVGDETLTLGLFSFGRFGSNLLTCRCQDSCHSYSDTLQYILVLPIQCSTSGCKYGQVN